MFFFLLKTLSPLLTRSSLGYSSGDALLAKAAASFLSICVLLFGLSTTFTKPHLERLKLTITSRLSFMSQRRFQALLWLGAALLIPEIVNAEAPLAICLAGVVTSTLTFMVVLASSHIIIEILLGRRISPVIWHFALEARPILTTRSLLPALRPPLFSA